MSIAVRALVFLCRGVLCGCPWCGNVGVLAVVLASCVAGGPCGADWQRLVHGRWADVAASAQQRGGRGERRQGGGDTEHHHQALVKRPYDQLREECPAGEDTLIGRGSADSAPPGANRCRIGFTPSNAANSDETGGRRPI